jgi:uncharacterized protein YxjI
MRERILDIGDDYFIETAGGTRVYKVNGKALRIRNTLDIEDMSGNVVVSIQERMLRVRDTMAVSQGGRQVAAVHKAVITPLRQRLSVEMMSAAPDMEAQGNILDHEYEIHQVGELVARVSKKWLRLVDTYDVDISPGQDDALVLAIAICIDQMAHD